MSTIYLVNTGDNDVQLRGWKVVDRGRDHVYRRYSSSPEKRSISVLGEEATAHRPVGPGSPCPEHTHYDFHWRLDNYVWNNDGDVAKLKPHSIGRYALRPRTAQELGGKGQDIVDTFA